MKTLKEFTVQLLIPAMMLTACVSGQLSAQEVTGDLPETATVSAEVKPQSLFIVDTIGDLPVRANEVRAGLLYDAERGAVVWQKDMYYAYPIASLTKMMVALLAVEDIKAGKNDWSDEVVVDRVYKKSRKSRSVYKTTETYTLESLVQLAMIPSNNLACADIGKYLNGDLATFVTRMNTRAAELNMKNTFYSNPSGLPGVVKEVDNSSSPHDLLLLALELLKHEEILKITSIGYAEVTNDKRTGIFRNHNHLVIDYENDVDGLKTGYTKRAKFCLVATSKKEGHRMISIVLGVDGPYLRNEIVASMLNSYYERIGCGPMTPTAGGPLARKSMISEPAKDELVAEGDSNVVYKTVWTKQKRTHTVRSGESLSVIAGKYNTSYQQIKKWNRLHSNKIIKGQKLLVYVNVPKKVAIKNPNVLDNEDETVPQVEEGALQIVENTNTNDSVKVDSSLAKAESTSVKKSPTPVKTQPIKKQPVAAKPIIKNYVYHVVQPGDTLWSIAKRYDGISVDDLKKTNNIHNSKSLKPGTKLKIKVKTS